MRFVLNTEWHESQRNV